MRIFSKPFFAAPLALLGIPIALKAMELLNTDHREKPLQFKKIGDGKHYVVTLSEEDAQRLSDQNMKRKFQEALEGK